MKTKIIVFSVALLWVFCAFCAPCRCEENPAAGTVSKTFQEKDFSYLAGMKGFSENMLSDHLKLYKGYVANSNTLIEKLSALADEGKARTPEYAELKRRLGWEMNGMKLHELYFSGLGKDGVIDENSALYKDITTNYGGFEKWKQDFVSTGAMRGIGWVVLYREPGTGRMINAWINEHDTGNFAGWDPILIMDVFEHAYMTDYRLDRAGYMEAFFANINWEEAERRLKDN